MQNTTLEEQQQLIQATQPEVILAAACKVGEGIIQIDSLKAKELRQRFYYATVSSAYFVPASGSGSRMFQFLFEFLTNPTEENRGAVERFLNHIEDFAFFYQFPSEIQSQLRERTMDIDAFVAYILNNKGMGLAHLPKGLVPFHKHGPFLLNPFHEHVLQGMEVTNNTCEFHFTIQQAFQAIIEAQLKPLEALTGKKIKVSYSIQNPETDAYTFDSAGQVVLNSEGVPLKRPAGHGALLSNLGQVNADLLFVKNIDNVQHIQQAEISIHTQQMLAGLLLEIQEEIERILEQPTKEAIEQFNQTYQFVHPAALNAMDLAEASALLRAPIRVCGMVRNEGQSGGGPFWIEENGHISKQIIEKAQINMRGDQYRVMIQSTHFNPVLMVCEGRKKSGEEIDFEQYKDNSKYFIVHKKHQGKDIRYIELPGLWNGSMANWNSVFVEVPSATFSPVKTILDLLEGTHRS
jgi:hypothetical protein